MSASAKTSIVESPSGHEEPSRPRTHRRPGNRLAAAMICPKDTSGFASRNLSFQYVHVNRRIRDPDAHGRIRPFQQSITTRGHRPNNR